MNILEVKGVHKKLGKRQIIKGINFSVREGEIFGFLGPNGAGKTTTIRMMVGLISPDQGSILIDGKDIMKSRENALMNIGAVVENPELYGYLTGRQNLKQIASFRKIGDAEIEEIIDLIGLRERIDDKVKKYSLGMKQRLGLGAALLGKPKLLILDEPTNGLDPSGILDFRNIVRKVSSEQKTAVFISSHILSEVQQLCDTVAFINNGEIQAIESVNSNNNKDKTEEVVLKTAGEEDYTDMLSGLDQVENVKKGEDTYVLTVKQNSTQHIIKALVGKDIGVTECFIKKEDLEDRYMELVEGGKRE